MPRLKPIIAVRIQEPANYGRRTSVSWIRHGRFELNGDNAVEHGGAGTGPDGFDLLAAALGQCLLTTLVAEAQRRRIELRGAEARVAVNPKEPGGGAAPYLSDFVVDLYIDADINEAEREALEEAASSLCGVRESLLRTPGITERLHVSPAPESP